MVAAFLGLSCGGPPPQPTATAPAANAAAVEVLEESELEHGDQWRGCDFGSQLERLAPRQPRPGEGGAITAVVTNADGRPLAGVTVVATSPALAGVRSGLTDPSGEILLSDLPAGVFTVTYYFADVTERQSHVEVLPHETTSRTVTIDPSRAGAALIEVERGPTIIHGPARRCHMGDFPPWPFADAPRR